MSHTPALYLGTKYVGFLVKGNKVFLQKCPKCNRENWAMSVAKGVCAWCGYDANNIENFKELSDKPKKDLTSETKEKV